MELSTTSVVHGHPYDTAFLTLWFLSNPFIEYYYFVIICYSREISVFLGCVCTCLSTCDTIPQEAGALDFSLFPSGSNSEWGQQGEKSNISGKHPDMIRAGEKTNMVRRKALA